MPPCPSASYNMPMLANKELSMILQCVYIFCQSEVFMVKLHEVSHLL